MLVANATHEALPSPAEDSLVWTGTYSLLCNNKKPTPVTVNLTTSGLQLRRKNYLEVFEFDEVASCTVTPYEDLAAEQSRCLRGGSDRLAFENDVCLQLVLYPHKGNTRRCRRLMTLLINSHSDYEENLSEAKLLQSKLASLIHIGHASSKPLLIILNPKSGKGKSTKIFERKVRPVLEDCNVKYHLLVTKHPNHASEFIESSVDLASSYSAIVTLSGDGLLFEVLNGFANLLDQSAADRKQIPIPLSIIPSGSGNGLAHSINHIYLNGSKSCNQIFDCTFHVIKGQPTDMDIVRVVTAHKVYYSFLSFGWGLMADVDIESERLRCIGEPRFAIWSIYRSVALKKYGGTLSYLPLERSTVTSIPPLGSDLDDSWVVEKGNFVLVYAAYQRFLNSTVKFAPDSKLDDKTIYLLYIKEGVSTCQVIQFLLSLEEGAHVKLPYVHFVPVRAFRLEPHNSTDIMTVDGEQIHCSTVQAEVVPRMASILLRA